MHQHPRPPVTAPPTSPPRPSSARLDSQRDQDAESNRPSSNAGSDTTRGLGIDPGVEASEQEQKATPAKEAMTKLNQIISNYHTKAALIILHSRVDLPPVYSKGSDTPRVNRWFNVELDETDVLRDSLRRWRTCDATDNRPPPMIIETFLDANELTNNQSLVILDDNGKRWDVVEALAASQDAAASSNPNEVILERWRVELGEPSGKPPPDLAAILPTVYKKSIVLFRSLFTYSKFLPAWKLAKRNGKMRASPALKIKYRIREASAADQGSGADNLTIPLHGGTGKVVETYSFGTTESPAGPFSVQVTYRISCDFRVDDSEALLSSRFMGADDDFFRPSLPTEESNRVGAQESESLPLERRGPVEQPDRTRAYGSLSTFHQVGPTTSASPISTLRAARELGTTSPSPSASPPQKLLPAAKIGPVGRAAALAGEGSSGVTRRPSLSFQPFKAPPLSASPSLVDPPLGASPRVGSGRTSAPATSADTKSMPPPTEAASASRKPATVPPEQAIASSTSASPKPAPISRYSSSFSHRRGRLSSGGTNRTDDDNNSSGKASATSSSAQPGSGILAEVTGTSGDSLHADDENISDFLKMLDLRKDLLNPVKAAAVDAATRRTSAALTRFQRMRDSNAALSDSMSSSLLLHRSSASSSRQLSNVPPMVAGTSISTSSSPGKPISPHTPHTPAIPSRLSSNSIVSYDDQEAECPDRPLEVEHDSPAEENANDETTHRATRSGANAIDIPKSPRPFGPSFRRSSSAAQHRRAATVGGDDDEIFPFGMRSVSLGAEERSHLSLSALLRQQEFENTTTNPDQPCPDAQQPSSINEDSANPGAVGSGPTAASTSSNHPYQARFSHSRGRGSSGGPQSHSSTSSSYPRGSAIPSHLAERERDREGSASGSNSGNSMADIRRGTGHRSSSGRSTAPPTTSFEEDEPLLFAMSDFGISRRSLEEGRRSSVGAESGGNSGGSRRGSGRRGTGLPSFHAWQ
ncbi:hypothetical protein VTN96DRAFT_1753 [Rasamsonia emersonii]